MKAETSNIISLKITPDLSFMLDEIAKKQDRSKSYILRKALENYLEDQKDLEDGIKALIEHKRGNGKTISLEKIITKYGLED
jgi:RHH-type rel operon transcriptional repressor/antitoxin RelB